MLRRILPRTILTSGICCLAVALSAGPSLAAPGGMAGPPGHAGHRAEATAAGGLTSERVAGIQGAVSCLRPGLCVLVGYDSRGVGDVVEVHRGIPGHVSVIHGSAQLDAVSCAGQAGCVAVGSSGAGVSGLFVSIGRSGVATRSRTAKLPAGVNLDQIACTGARSCVVAGTDIFTSPATIEIGTWNGRRVRLHKVRPPKGTANPQVRGLACAGASCEAVGYAQAGAANRGLVLTIKRGRPRRLRTLARTSLYGVSCPSSSRCYAAGFTQHGGVVVTVSGGKPRATAAVKPDLFGIACSGSSCTAAGEQLAPPSVKGPFIGVLVSVRSGRASGSQLVPKSGGFSDIAGQRHGYIAAVGAAQGKGSEVTAG